MDPKNKSATLQKQLSKIEEYETSIQEMKKELAELSGEEGIQSLPFRKGRVLFCRIISARLIRVMNELSDYMVHVYDMRECRSGNPLRYSDFVRQLLLHGLWHLPDADKDPRPLTEKAVLEHLESEEIKQKVKQRFADKRNYFEL